MIAIDAHQHFWIYSPEQYPWIQPEWPIRRDFLPADLAPLLDQQGIQGSIAVQARQSIEESRWLLELADREPRILGVVGWVDLRSPAVHDQLAELAAHPRFVGVRHVAQDEPDDSFLSRAPVIRGIRALRDFKLTYDILVFPRQLPAALELVRALPDQPFVLDHIAKPQIRDGTLEPWAEGIRQLARHPNVTCKISGLVTEARWQDWTEDQFRPYLDTVFEAFGPDRLMCGSDWPVCLLAGSYAQVHELVKSYAAHLDPEQQSRFYGGTALRFYLQRVNPGTARPHSDSRDNY